MRNYACNIFGILLKYLKNYSLDIILNQQHLLINPNFEIIFDSIYKERKSQFFQKVFQQIFNSHNCN